MAWSALCGPGWDAPRSRICADAAWQLSHTSVVEEEEEAEEEEVGWGWRGERLGR
jgi:hypothetical protein